MKGSIINLIGERLVEILTAYCQNNIEDKEFSADLIRQGKLQEDPTAARIYILINPANPNSGEDRPYWSDRVADSVSGPVEIAAYEMGGGQRWWRRFKVEIGCFFTETQEERDRAREIALWQLSRVQQALRENMAFTNADGSMMRDEFGELAVMLAVDAVVPVESGGENSRIWRCYVFAQVLTEAQ